MELKLANYTEIGVLIIKLEDIAFRIEVVKDHLTKMVKTTVEYAGMNHSGQYEMQVRHFPDTVYMQLLVHQVSSD